MTEEFPLFEAPSIEIVNGFQPLVDVYSQATTWLGLAAVEQLKRHKEMLEFKVAVTQAKKQGSVEDILDARLALYQSMAREIDLLLYMKRVEIFTDFVDENIPDVVGKAARDRAERYAELLPSYYRVLLGAE
jgi:hypothetical protein